MTKFEQSVISLLKVIANGQRLMIHAMHKTSDAPASLQWHDAFLDSVLQSLKLNAESERLSQQLRDQAGDGTGEQTGG